MLKEPFKKYTLKCQNWDNRFKLSMFFNEDKLSNDILSDNILSFKINSLQGSKQKDILNWNSISIQALADMYWKLKAKQLVRRCYGMARRTQEGKLLCDKCYTISKLKE